MISIETIVERAPSSRAFVDALQAYASTSTAAHHPLLVALADGRFTDTPRALRVFLREYYAYSRSFTRHLAAVSSTLEDPAHRAALVPNAAEEAGELDDDHEELLVAHGLEVADVAAPHPELFRRFLQAIGEDPATLAEHVPDVSTSAWIETFHAICRADEAQGTGALGVATEGIVRVMYARLLEAIDKAWPCLAARDKAFFVLHAAVDDAHADVLRELAVAIATSAEARRRMAIGVVKALSARVSFYDAMLDRLLRDERSAAAGVAMVAA